MSIVASFPEIFAVCETNFVIKSFQSCKKNACWRSARDEDAFFGLKAAENMKPIIFHKKHLVACHHNFLKRGWQNYPYT